MVSEGQAVTIRSFTDTTGAENAFAVTGGTPVISNIPYFCQITDGNVSGWEPWTKTGYNGALSSSWEDMWTVSSGYTFPDAEMQMEVVSSSEDDTDGGGGVQSVYINYLDDEFVEKSEIITLAGTTPVATSASDIYRIQNFRAKTVGTTGLAVGNIDIRNTADTPIYGRIPATENRAKTCVWTVPKDKKLCVTSVYVSSGANVSGRAVRFQIQAKYDSVAEGTTTFFSAYSDLLTEDSSIYMPLEMPTTFPEGVDIKVRAISPDGASYGAVMLKGVIKPA